jgi:hypothetical protein
MKFCCTQFEGWFSEAGLRGVGIYCYRAEDKGLQFVMQYRALDPSAPVPHSESPMSFVCDMHILWCPWCGANLRDFYGDAPIPERPELKVTTV